MNHNRRSATTTTDHTRGKRIALRAILGPHAAPSVRADGIPGPRELADFAESLAPKDLFDGCYVLAASEIPRRFRPDKATLGYWSRVLDLQLQRPIERLGIWSGRKPAVVINQNAIRQVARESWGRDLERVRCARWLALAITIHELAHALSNPIDREEPPAEIAKSFSQAAAKRLANWIAGDEAEKRSPPPSWSGHGIGFIRALCHLIHRAEAAGIDRDIPGRFYFASSYGLSSIRHYGLTLRDEITSMSDAAFHEIRATPPPSQFIEQFRKDLERWSRLHNAAEDLPLHIAAELGPFIRAGLNDRSDR